VPGASCFVPGAVPRALFRVRHRTEHEAPGTRHQAPGTALSTKHTAPGTTRLQFFTIQTDTLQYDVDG